MTLLQVELIVNFIKWELFRLLFLETAQVLNENYPESK